MYQKYGKYKKNCEYLFRHGTSMQDFVYISYYIWQNVKVNGKILIFALFIVLSVGFIRKH